LEELLIEKEFYRYFNRKVVIILFIVIFITNVFINVDHGSLPGCADVFKSQLGINDFEFGLIGSVVYAGMAAGSVIASGLFNNASWIKLTIIGVVSLNAAAVWTF